MWAALAFQLALGQLPLPYVAMCAERQYRACAVDVITVDDLAALHRLISEAYAPDDSDAASSPDDPWRIFPPDMKMDCDDLVASERAALEAFGLDPRAMSIETGKVTEPDGHVLGHVVLIVELDGRRWVLDRKVPQGIYEDGKRPYRWTQSARQSHKGILWSSGE